MALIKMKFKPKNPHGLLALALCLPCLIITTIALSFANVSAYLIAFILIVLTLIATFTVVISEQRAQQQIRTLGNILESMIDGDYSLRGRAQSDQAFQELLTLVNNLSDTLALSKIEAKESRQLLERIMQQMDAMVIAIDEQGRIVIANDSAQKLLQIEILPRKSLYFADLAIGKDISEAQGGIITFTESQLQGEHFLFKESFLSEGKQHQLFLITSAQRLLLEKERKSWQSLLRVLSHEMNNSLTPIASISQAMQQKLHDENKALNRESLLTGVGIINERASSLSSFIDSYSQLSHLPEPNKTSFTFNDFIHNCAALFSDDDIFFEINCQEIANITADKAQLEQVLINLFKNAIEAMQVNTIHSTKCVEVYCQIDEKYNHIHICDSGSGIANQDNLFVPLYSTKPQGSGIGLTLCKQILFNHDGLITLSNRNKVQGAQAIISLPKE